MTIDEIKREKPDVTIIHRPRGELLMDTLTGKIANEDRDGHGRVRGVFVVTLAGVFLVTWDEIKIALATGEPIRR